MASLLETLQRTSLNLRGYTSVELDTSVGRVHAYDSGCRRPGPPLVLLHGFSASAGQYGPLMQRLEPHFGRVVAVDIPAHGFSAAPSGQTDGTSLRTGLFEALDRLLAWNAPAVLLGNSMGGYAAIRYAQARPERIAGLVLISPGGALMDATTLEQLRQRFRLETHQQALDFVDQLLARSPPAWLRGVIAWAVRRQMRKAALQELLSSLHPNELLRPEDLQFLPAPALLIWGQQDRILPRESRDFYVRNLSGAQIEEPPHFGHSPQLEDPEEVAAMVRRFVAGSGFERAA